MTLHYIILENCLWWPK